MMRPRLRREGCSGALIRVRPGQEPIRQGRPTTRLGPSPGRASRIEMSWLSCHD